MPTHVRDGTTRPRRVRLLDEDPELGAHLSPEDFASARRYAVAELAELERGLHVPWGVGAADLLGLLVLDGLLVRSVQVAERRCGELVGPERSCGHGITSGATPRCPSRSAGG